MNFVRWFWVLAISLLVGTLGWVGLCSHNTRTRATSFLSDLAHLQPGTSDKEAAANLAKRHGGVVTSKLCDASSCEYWFFFENTMLARLKLAPNTKLTTYVRVEDGKLSFVNLNYWLGQQAWIVVNESSCSTCQDLPSAELDLRRDGDGKAQRAVVTLKPESAPDLRHRALQLNANCLSKVGGCSDASELAPELWRLESAKPPVSSHRHTGSQRDPAGN